jgi:predicted transcriptional regulator
MDKILSARVDETTIRKIGLLAQKLKKTKKAVIEEAIRS